jgi:hypothetical protein
MTGLRGQQRQLAQALALEVVERHRAHGLALVEPGRASP